MIRTGLVGYGLAGSVFHEPLISACDLFELTAVLTSRDHPLKVDSLEHLFGRSELVVIASPNQSHFPIGGAALEAGKHVVIDKPFTVTTDEAKRLIEIARGQDLLLSAFHNRRWDGDFLTVEKILPRLGELFLFESNWDRFRPTIKKGWREEPEAGGGLLNDLGPHLIDQVMKLFGMPDTVEADIGSQRAGAKVDDYFDITLTFGRKRACLRSSSVVAARRPRFGVHGALGSFVKTGLDPQEAQLRAGMRPTDPGFGVDLQAGMLVLADGSSNPVPTEHSCYRAFYEKIAASILEGAPVPVRPEEAIDGLLLIDLARRAAALGQRLPVPAASLREGSVLEA